jgi:polysaccharide deacetylase 2 family uncharacterized protein YibQ
VARGFLGGFLKGTLLGVGTLGVMSVYSGWDPAARGPDSVVLEVPVGSQFNQSRDDVAATAPGPIETPVLPTMPQVVAPKLEATDAEVVTEAPRVPQTNDMSPVAPKNETAMISPDVGLPQPELGVQQPIVPNNDLRPIAPRAEGGVPLTDGPAQPQLAEDVAVPQTPAIAEDAGLLPQDPEPAPSVFDTQEPTTFKSGSNDTRLPTVGDASSNAAPPALENAQSADIPQPIGRAIDLYASAAVETDGKPMLSFIVMLDGQADLDPAMIQALPFPVAYAIDALSPTAAANMQLLRDLNQEVIAMVGLPLEASATDTEITLASVLNLLPNTIAIMERDEGALQVSRDANAHVPEVLARTGHGVLVYEKGLTSILRAAEKMNLPSAAIYKDLDGEGQNERTIRRFLDGAMMRASNTNEKGAIVVARLKPDTISALLMWSFQDRASRVAIVPVSQRLKAE